MSREPRRRSLLGGQTPTHRLVPAAWKSRGDEAIGLAELAGLTLDPWQKQFLRDALGIQVDGQWAAFEAGLELSRQNGKSVVFEVRALAGLYLFREKLIIYTAHKGETVNEAFLRIDDIISTEPELKSEVKRVSHTNGKAFIELYSKQRLVFRTRTSGGGRGLSGDCVILDEAQALGEDEHSALLPTISARPNPQIWYGGSAGGQASTVLGRLVARCEARDPDLAMSRWAASEDDDPASPRTWARVNPALGRRIRVETIAKEQRSLAPEKFAAERLGIGDYPRPPGEDWVIPESAWTLAVDEASTAVGPVVFAIDVKPDRSWAAIAAAGRRADGAKHIEVIQHDPGTRWVVPRILTLLGRHPNYGLVIDPAGPAGSLIGDLEDEGIEVTTTTAQQMAQACGAFYDGVVAEPAQIRHRGAPVLLSALSSASTRKLQDAWAWRRLLSADISPLVAATLAAHGLTRLTTRPKAPPGPPLLAPSRGRVSETADLATASF